MTHDQHHQEVSQVEHHIAHHLRHGGHTGEIYKELNHLRAEDAKHGRNFHKDLEHINSALHSDLAHKHLPLMTISEHGKDFQIKAEAAASSSEAEPPETRRFMDTVRHSIGHHRQRMHGHHSSEGAFAPPEEGGHYHREFKNNSEAAPSKTGFGKALLEKLGLPVTEQNLAFLDAWQKAEGGSADNPFNTTQNWQGAHSINHDGVKRYDTVQEGLDATAKTLQYGYYSGIVSALRNGDSAHNAAIALSQSRWGTGDLVREIVG
jgi:hypothetical protein